VRLAPRDDLDLGQQGRLDGVGYQTGETLLQSQRLLNANHGPGVVCHADNQPPTGGVGKGHQGAQCRVG
jgi:hypothetical protein